jgi:hypothetical protein
MNNREKQGSETRHISDTGLTAVSGKFGKGRPISVTAA